jgi:hypothetical protein
MQRGADDECRDLSVSGARQEAEAGAVVKTPDWHLFCGSALDSNSHPLEI